MNLNQQIAVVNTEGIREYPSAREFLESLKDHLKVLSKLPAGLSMISVQQDAPGQEYQDVPWLQLDEGNNPIALKFYNGDQWTEIAADRAVKSFTRGEYVQRGQFEYTLSAVKDNWVSSKSMYIVDGVASEFKFQYPFKNGTYPTVIIQPRHSGIMLKVSALNEAMKVNLDEVTNTGFSLQTNVHETTILNNDTFKFDFIAIGEIEE
jgi:hypothetical protein